MYIFVFVFIFHLNIMCLKLKFSISDNLIYRRVFLEICLSFYPVCDILKWSAVHIECSFILTSITYLFCLQYWLIMYFYHSNYTFNFIFILLNYFIYTLFIALYGFICLLNHIFIRTVSLKNCFFLNFLKGFTSSLCIVAGKQPYI